MIEEFPKLLLMFVSISGVNLFGVVRCSVNSAKERIIFIHVNRIIIIQLIRNNK